MTVSELIKTLKEFDQSMEVMFQYPSGDYWRTELVGSIDDVIWMTVEWSEYHREYSIPRDDDKDTDDMERPKRVVILR